MAVTPGNKPPKMTEAMIRLYGEKLLEHAMPSLQFISPGWESKPLGRFGRFRFRVWRRWVLTREWVGFKIAGYNPYDDED